MPQKVPWSDDCWLVAFRGRSAEGDILLDFAKFLAMPDSTARMLSWDDRVWNWWAQHPALLKALIHLCATPSWEPPFWQKTFAPCETHFKSGLTLEGAVIVVKRSCSSPERWQTGIPKNFTYVQLRHSEQAMSTLQSAINQERPVLFHQWDDDQKRFLFGPNLWKVKQDELAADSEHFRLMFLEAVDKDRLQFERLKNKFSGLAGAKAERSREPIPEGVRIFVWRRDGGKCVRCGSDQRLEFDHIIPVKEGGSNTERNLQLLCETCNRRKGATI